MGFMNIGRRASAVLAAGVIVLSLCAMKPIAADDGAFSSINEVVFLTTPNPTSFMVSTLESRNRVGVAAALFGISGTLVAGTMSETEIEKQIKENLAGQDLGTDLHAALKERLEAQGYHVDSVEVKRPQVGDMMKKYSHLKIAGDAYLDVTVDGGYTDRYTEDAAICPLLRVDVRFVRKPSRILFAQTYEYSCRKKVPSTLQVVGVDARYQFKDHNAVADNAELTREALSAGVPLIADQIAASLRKEPVSASPEPSEPAPIRTSQR
jgi:hypothetical protein